MRNRNEKREDVTNMAKYTLSPENWAMTLADLIKNSEDGDIIIVSSEAQKELGIRAKNRRYPEKSITFLVKFQDDNA